MSLSQHVRTLGRGPGRSRSLTQSEAQEAMRLMLSGQAAPEAVGALLMLLRMKGETAEEIAGFAQAAADECAREAGLGLPQVDLDWPSYAAGRTRGQPWFLLSAKVVARSGFRVLVHGWNGTDEKVRSGLAEAGIGLAVDPAQAAQFLDRDGIAYMPLERLNPGLFRLLSLREVLGLRSCVNTVCRMLNPAGAQASVQGVFHPSYRLLQSEAAALLGWRALSVIKGAGGEFERNPAKDIAAFGLRNGHPWEQTFPARRQETRRLNSGGDLRLPDLMQADRAPSFETDLILGTAALALDTLGVAEAAQLAQSVWTQGLPSHAA